MKSINTVCSLNGLVHTVGVVLLLALGGYTQAKVFFEDDFDSGAISQGASPDWSWPTPSTEGNPEKGMMYGPDDVYYISNQKSRSGRYSLGLKLDGRNGWCNVCGSYEKTISSSEASSGCISVSGSTWDDQIFNKSDGFSVWNITSTSSNQVCVNKNSAVMQNIFSGGGALSTGDVIKVPYKCGVNGNVGGNISRRSDCNKAINYLSGVSASDLPYGGTIARRFYLYIPSETTLPGMTLKLAYTHWRRGGRTVSATLKLSVQRNLTMEVSMPTGGKYIGNPAIEKDTWYYFEEVFTRESSSGGSDANYKLYVGKDGETEGLLLTNETNFELGELVDISINGNFQHNNDVRGYIYIDDVKIADEYIGPDGGISPPRAPSLTIN